MKIPPHYRLILASALISALAYGNLYLSKETKASAVVSGLAALIAGALALLALRRVLALPRQFELKPTPPDCDPALARRPEPERVGSIGTIRTEAGLAFRARAYGIVGGVLHTDAGRFRRHTRRPGVWVCVRDETREFTFGAPPRA